MRLSVARIVLGILGGGALLAALVVDYPTLSEGKLWSDGATYLAMSLSLARDGDLRYESRDLARFEEIYAYGPHGLFLKKSAGGFYSRRRFSIRWWGHRSCGCWGGRGVFWY